ncbi:hypothetical protein GGX14DRAFT_397290 [Mycena pura]|uniref:Uncharacterized protein n=1 Tax=Mycena pura TaxID=153505 RepID=A0AAD6VAV1_9AGAR|nr:hypothetical protein GGX14DRAFT_397290 [Mycena pura]
MANMCSQAAKAAAAKPNVGGKTGKNNATKNTNKLERQIRPIPKRRVKKQDDVSDADGARGFKAVRKPRSRQRTAIRKPRATTQEPEHDVAASEEEGEESGNKKQDTVISRETRAKAKARAAEDDAAASEQEENENEKLSEGDSGDADVDPRWAVDTPTPAQNISRLKRVPTLDLAMMKSLKLVTKAPLPTETQPQLPETQVLPTKSKRQAVKDMVEAAKNGDKAGGKPRRAAGWSAAEVLRQQAQAINNEGRDSDGDDSGDDWVEREAQDRRNIALRAPDDSVLQKEYEFKCEDYEKKFGKFVPDSEHAAWFARRQEEIDSLLAMREGLVDLSPFEGNGPKFEEYFKREAAFVTEFGISFKVDDTCGATLETKRRLLKHYTRLLKRTNGDIHAATHIAGACLQFTVINPFKLDDDRRRDFDSKLRQWYAAFHDFDVATLESTLGNREFAFDLPNKYKVDDKRRLPYWCHRCTWAEFIKDELLAAREQARLLPPVRTTISATQFYSGGTSSFYGALLANSYL